MRVACLLLTHLGARVEMRRHPRLKDRPAVIIDRSRGKPLVADRFPAASGARAGMTMEEAMSRHAGSVVLEADGPTYRSVFHRMLVSLQGVSDRVEGGELGTAYARMDGLEELYGGEARLVTRSDERRAPHDLAPRVGVGDVKFPAFVAVRAASPLGALRVPRDAAAFLSPHPVDLPPISTGARADMQRFGLRTLGDDVAAVRQELLVDRLGPDGRMAWELSRGIDHRFLAPMK